MTDQTKEYIRRLYQENHPLILEMENYAKENHIPIMEKDGIEFLKQLIRLHRPKHVLEIGAAIGYSAIQMAMADSNVNITTVEKDSERFKEAQKNVKLAGLDRRINIVFADANDFLESMNEQFDFAFIDAAKGQYRHYVEKIDPYLNRGGLIVIDNVLFKGYVSKEVQERERLIKLGEKIDYFNQWLMKHPNYQTTIVATGDGVAIALKR
ncbi:O-methyltransferase [Tenuibacillus multivorans]|uniref:tRNA 5-hydroxyuridine methyltransferase n=1 Tax=Tenuibacillus multivorans TaxID=237069 RepID=A0A1G9ZI07_9BACI|nr:O-methyltransferase [Tenuibacillus multivorans]GEL77503.1 SAM-dependent methyltransferase [Tenuibacillus multivorans]SDN20661.1 Predicted O-methyltransferase YrrM [Tenuibacillus multivorans]